MNPEFRSKAMERAPIANVGSEEIPDISLDEVHISLHPLKNGKTLGDDGFILKMIKSATDYLKSALATLFYFNGIENTTDME